MNAQKYEAVIKYGAIRRSGKLEEQLLATETADYVARLVKQERTERLVFT